MSNCQEQKTFSLKDDLYIPLLSEEKEKVLLGACCLGQSAIDNKIDMDSFIVTMHKFSDESYALGTPLEVIYKWREVATEYYLSLSVAKDISDRVEATDNIKPKKK